MMSFGMPRVAFSGGCFGPLLPAAANFPSLATRVRVFFRRLHRENYSDPACGLRSICDRIIGLRLLGWLPLRHDLAGGGPAAGPFFLLRQKEVTKKKATARLLPFGFPKAGASQGECRKLASLKQCVTLIPCLTPAFGSCLNAGQVNGQFNSNFNRNFNRNFNSNLNRITNQPPSCFAFSGRRQSSQLATRGRVFFRRLHRENYSDPGCGLRSTCDAISMQGLLMLHALRHSQAGCRVSVGLVPRSRHRFSSARTHQTQRSHSPQRYTSVPPCAPRSLT